MREAAGTARCALVGLLQQSALGRLARYEDVIGAERLHPDPAMRQMPVVGGFIP